ncbi:AAC(3) family N-acetyltransferase [uncultured Piscinibacter sp.]|uniref:AAC(3) family N-acetyltransferase n=1 Tax=uncultured Piscinibacter sp. TaxID=1131835 RepID=UPI00260A220E|nr:AAC(3) family N-acetyltransferase [uncultured Piscinibacter sp.]
MVTISLRPRHLRKWLKARWFALRASFVRLFLSYGRVELLQALREIGVREGDAVMLHSAFAPHHGFRGSIEELTDTFIDAVGPNGHLLMVSLPYRSSSLQYLEKLRQFDVRRTPSMMGLVSEFFRRRPEVLRSLHPTHPVLVRGPRAESFIEGHEHCIHPCGPGTPFERLAEADGMVAFLNVEFGTFTFFHHLEHLVSAQLPFPLYTANCFEVSVIDRDGRPGTVRTHVYSPEAIQRRRFPVLERALRARGAIRSVRVGNTQIEAIRVRDAIACVSEMSRRGEFFYDLSGVVQAPRNHSIEGA